MNWIEEIQSITTEYLHEFGELSMADLNLKLSDNTWSIGEVVEHLITTNSLYFKIFDDVLSNKYRVHWLAGVPGVPSLLGNMILKGVEPDTQKKSKTVKVFEPQLHKFDDQLWHRFESCQLKMANYFSQLKEEHLKMVISSPANRAIVYPLGTAINIIVSHEKRHFNQALKIKSQF